MQGGIERALAYLQNFVGDLLDSLGDRPSVLRLQRDGVENQEV
jgi:hypothetical protein